ncbi:MazG family protein [Williamsia sterculiae]|uniref:XTP/dITP diphosphohydrolase n=1 Tax=Williamsia sterculiae TaxID=1344003 RepID=A0A1N7DPP2_9NOCA|nr:XTP/dITP diphosphohydrolase [Williamsia sterculiae]
MTDGEPTAADVRTGAALLEAVALMDRLRRTGPWEGQQTHDSLRRYLLEETYELLDAIDSGDPDDVLEELADLLLQVLFHARIAADHPDAPFDIDDVATAFTTKISSRSAGVLSGETDIEAQIRQWEDRKAAEKQRTSVLDGVATSQPALALAQKVFERLLAAGFPADLFPDDLTTIRVIPGDRSVEDDARQRVLVFMAAIADAEARARVDGRRLTAPADWRDYL